MTYALEVDQVGKIYDGFALDGIDFKLEQGMIMGLIGTNGAGKTTLIQLILGLLQEKTGSIRIYGHDISKEEVKAKDLCGFILDENPFITTISAKDNGRMYGPYYSGWNMEKFLKYLKQFEVDPKKPLKKLSQGTILKFQLAFALSHNAKLFVFDEPAAGLDPIFRRELMEICQDLVLSEDRSILFSTHLTNDLDKVADYITMLHHGKMKFSMAKEELLDRYQLVRGSKNQITALGEKVTIGVREFDTYCEALVNRQEEGIRIPVAVMQPSIEDIMYYTVHASDRRR